MDSQSLFADLVIAALTEAVNDRTKSVDSRLVSALHLANCVKATEERHWKEALRLSGTQNN